MRRKLPMLDGQRFGRWQVVRLHMKEPDRSAMWWCRCDCGKEKPVSESNLKTGKTVSCGCFKNEVQSKRTTTHGMSKTPEYRTWTHMIDRCENPKCEDYPHYGGRGIKICERWRASFQDFYSDMGPRPRNHEIDRVRNEDDYKPDNCRWATRSEQMRNTRCSHNITFNGKTMCISAWAKHAGMSLATLIGRLKKWPFERALTQPLRRR